ncbi:MAG TPA: aldehyde dehydrogenase family protein, partial [Pseudomonadales bacterium]|nr:aldehyde dehydrogenase family protein [Pseudomonadales bacterium]
MNAVARPAVATPQHFINGEFVSARSGGTFEVVDPATEQLTAMAARGDAQDVAAAVKAAKDAF